MPRHVSRNNRTYIFPIIYFTLTYAHVKFLISILMKIIISHHHHHIGLQLSTSEQRPVKGGVCHTWQEGWRAQFQVQILKEWWFTPGVLFLQSLLTTSTGRYGEVLFQPGTPQGYCFYYCFINALILCFLFQLRSSDRICHPCWQRCHSLAANYTAPSTSSSASSHAPTVVNPNSQELPDNEMENSRPDDEVESVTTTVENTQSVPTIILSQFGRASDTQAHCFFPGCTRTERLVVPLSIRVSLFADFRLCTNKLSRLPLSFENQFMAPA